MSIYRETGLGCADFMIADLVITHLHKHSLVSFGIPCLLPFSKSTSSDPEPDPDPPILEGDFRNVEATNVESDREVEVSPSGPRADVEEEGNEILTGARR